jgi:hypothetical protein
MRDRGRRAGSVSTSRSTYENWWISGAYAQRAGTFHRACRPCEGNGLKADS